MTVNSVTMITDTINGFKILSNNLAYLNAGKNFFLLNQSNIKSSELLMVHDNSSELLMVHGNWPNQIVEEPNIEYFMMFHNQSSEKTKSNKIKLTKINRNSVNNIIKIYETELSNIGSTNLIKHLHYIEPI